VSIFFETRSYHTVSSPRLFYLLSLCLSTASLPLPILPLPPIGLSTYICNLSVADDSGLFLLDLPSFNDDDSRRGGLGVRTR
jgi:hypothetical protein